MCKMATVEQIADQLRILGLPTDRIPSLEKVKKAVRDNYLKKHPDKAAQQEGTEAAGQADNAAFVEVNEAARIVYGFLAEHHNVVDDTTEDEKLLSILKASEKLKYNKDSITLSLDPSWGEELITSIEKRLGPRQPLSERGKAANNPGIIMSCNDLQVPWISDKSYGSVTVTVWLNTKQNRPKLLVQGRAYFSFVCLALPYIIRDTVKVRQEIENFSSSPGVESTGHAGTPPSELTGPPTGPTSTAAPLDTAVAPLSAGSVHPPPPPPPPTSCVCATLISSFHELESTIVGMRRDLVDKLGSVEKSVLDIQTNLASSVEAKVSAKFSRQFEAMNVKLDNMASQASVCAINQELKTSNLVSSKELSGVKELVSSVQKTQTTSLTKLTLVEERVKDAVESLKMCKTPDMATKPEKEKLPEVIPKKRKKGLIFSSSLGKHTDIEKMSKTYNCDFSLFTTYYIERNDSAQEPDKNLVQVLGEEMNSDVDLAIFQVGSNEISVLDLYSAPTTLQSKVYEQSKTILEIAKDMAANHDCQVFVSQRPPRYDTVSSPGKLNFAQLSEYANAVLQTESVMLDNVNIINQQRLGCQAGKLRTDRYSPDGIHLTKKGTQLLNQNWMAKICEIVPDLAVSGVTDGDSESDKNLIQQKKGPENGEQAGLSGRARTQSGASVDK